MLLVSVQNQKTNERKTCVVLGTSIERFLQEHVPSDCVAVVVDVPCYWDNQKYSFDYFDEITKEVFDNGKDFKKKWYNSKND